MTIYGKSAEFATVTEGADLFQISEGRLKFKENSIGLRRAKFMVTEENAWRRIRLTFRRPGLGLRFENSVVARFLEINRATLETIAIAWATSQTSDSESDEIKSELSVSTISDQRIDFQSFFYQIEVIMIRSHLLARIDHRFRFYSLRAGGFLD